MHPRTVQAAATAVLLLGFVADARAVVPFVAVVLIAQLVVGPRLFEPDEEMAARLTVVVEVVLLAIGTLFVLLGHAGWGWALAFIVALVGGAAAVAEVWLRPVGTSYRRLGVGQGPPRSGGGRGWGPGRGGEAAEDTGSEAP